MESRWSGDSGNWDLLQSQYDLISGLRFIVVLCDNRQRRTESERLMFEVDPDRSTSALRVSNRKVLWYVESVYTDRECS